MRAGFDSTSFVWAGSEMLQHGWLAVLLDGVLMVWLLPQQPLACALLHSASALNTALFMFSLPAADDE